MQLTPDQVKGRIKSVAQKNKADARTLMRIYMMERFLERVAVSQYKDNFIIKQLHALWKSYQNKYPYAATISYEDIMESTKSLLGMIQ